VLATAATIVELVPVPSCSMTKLLERILIPIDPVAVRNLSGNDTGDGLVELAWKPHRTVTQLTPDPPIVLPMNGCVAAAAQLNVWAVPNIDTPVSIVIVP